MRESVELFDSAGDRRGRATALNNLGVVLRQTGRYAEAEEYMRRALALAEEVGDQRGGVYIRNALGAVRLLAGDPVEADRLQTQALETARELRDRRGQVYSLNYLGAVRRCTGQWADAAEAHEEALGTARVLGDKRAEGHALCHLAFVRIARGDAPAAAVAAGQALAVVTALGDRRGMAGALRAEGATHVAGGPCAGGDPEPDRRAGPLRGDRRPARSCGAAERPGEVRLAQADATAEDLHREAAALARTLGSPLEEARALAGLGRYERSRGEPDLAAGLLQRALTLFTRIGAAEQEGLSAELHTL
ncbi:tetratricopeptide repeat protein [Streptomyces sp. NPDC051567]|uniref:tetratricopeptide repeat protein n=1 Tax=Streptomyces sp. NPDC051567 TaxID=3365660 RepID=UPI00378E8815